MWYVVGSRVQGAMEAYQQPQWSEEEPDQGRAPEGGNDQTEPFV